MHYWCPTKSQLCTMNRIDYLLGEGPSQSHLGLRTHRPLGQPPGLCVKKLQRSAVPAGQCALVRCFYSLRPLRPPWYSIEHVYPCIVSSQINSLQRGDRVITTYSVAGLGASSPERISMESTGCSCASSLSSSTKTPLRRYFALRYC